jgi:hypothetical protein
MSSIFITREVGIKKLARMKTAPIIAAANLESLRIEITVPQNVKNRMSVFVNKNFADDPSAYIFQLLFISLENIF